MSYSQLFETVIDKELCTHCGACEVACLDKLIEIKDLKPSLSVSPEPEACTNCSDCLDVCPGADPHTPDSERYLFGRTRTEEERWLGIYQNVLDARAVDEKIYEASGSGGSVTALLKHGMEHVGLDWVLVCGRDTQRPYRASPKLCRDPGKLQQYAQSTYQLAAHLVPLREVLESDEETCGAVAGLACHMQAIRRLQQLDSPLGERARRRILFLIEIACSSNTLPSGTESLITDDLGLELDDVVNVFYREGTDYPGSFAVETRDQKRHRLPLWQAFSNFKKHKTHRCLSCPDWLSGLADISVIDGDPNIFIASVQGESEFSKCGKLLVRTAVGSALIEAARASGTILAESAEIRTGNLGLERKRSRRHSYERQSRIISAPPIPGYVEPGEVLDDETLLAVRDRTSSLRVIATEPSSTRVLDVADEESR